jgi:FixJ family two-component response regulator
MARRGASFREHLPDVTLMDLRLPDGSGIDAMVDILAEFPEARIIMLTMFDGDAEIQRALKLGARGYLLKSMPTADLIQVIRRVHAGKKHIPAEIAAHLAEHLGEETLTARETEVLRCVAEGKRNREIGEKLFITEETVKVHVKTHNGQIIRRRPDAGGRHRARAGSFSYKNTKNSPIYEISPDTSFVVLTNSSSVGFVDFGSSLF